MASAVASKGGQQAALLRKLLAAPSASDGAPLACALRPAAGAGARRFFSTGGESLRRYDDDGDLEDSSDDVSVGDRRCARAFSSPMFFSADVLDRYRAPTTLDQLLALMEDAAAPGTGSGLGAAAARRGWWVAKEDDDAVVLKVPMPGLGKEHVKVWAEKNTLVVKGEGDKETEDGDDDFAESGPPRYTLRLDIPRADKFKMDKLRAEMKNGMLRVTVPKVKEEERKDVFVVKVE